MTDKVKIAVYLSRNVYDKLMSEKDELQISHSSLIAIALTSYFRRQPAPTNGKKDPKDLEEERT